MLQSPVSITSIIIIFLEVRWIDICLQIGNEWQQSCSLHTDDYTLGLFRLTRGRIPGDWRWWPVVSMTKESGYTLSLSNWIQRRPWSEHATQTYVDKQQGSLWRCRNSDVTSIMTS